MKKRALLFLVSFGLLAALIYFSDPSKILTTLLGADLRYVFLALAFWLLGWLVRSYRWDFLLKRSRIEIPFLNVLKYYVTGMFISNLSPAKSADPIRAVFIKRLDGESFSKSVSSIFAERIFDIITMVIIGVVGLVVLFPSSDIFLWVYGSIFIYIFLIALGVYLVFSGKKLEKILSRIISVFSFVPAIEALEERIEKFSKKFRSSLAQYKKRKTAGQTLLLTALIWITKALQALSIFIALNLEVSFLVVLTVSCAGTLIGILTFLPGSLGSGEIISVSLYSLFLSYSVSQLTSVVLLARLTGFLAYGVVGAIVLSTFEKKILSFDFSV